MIDFSGLTDDQLAELVRAACVEAVNRNEAVAAAVRQVMLSEAEKVAIAKQAAEREMLRLRAEEAERVAAQAVARVRAEVAGQALEQRTAEMGRLRELRVATAAPITAALGPDWAVRVETSRDGVRMVKVEACYDSRDGVITSSNYAAWIILYVNGTTQYEPGSFRTYIGKYANSSAVRRLKEWKDLPDAERKVLKDHLRSLDQQWLELLLYCRDLNGSGVLRQEVVA